MTELFNAMTALGFIFAALMIAVIFLVVVSLIEERLRRKYSVYPRTKIGPTDCG
jgi:hypothetical protein